MLAKYFLISLRNPLKTWWKARKFFRFPTPHLYFLNPAYTRYWEGRIFRLTSRDLYWKEKWGESRHEYSPEIELCLFNRIGLKIRFEPTYLDELGKKQNAAPYYWEYLLDWLYFNKPLKDIPTWTSDSKIYQRVEFGDAEDKKYYLKSVVPIPLFSLNKRGLQQLQKEVYGTTL